jgi:hypothetical protein
VADPRIRSVGRGLPPGRAGLPRRLAARERTPGGPPWKPGRDLLATALLAAALAASAARAADGPPAVARPDARTPVTVSDDGKTFTLANGIVTARVNKRNGDLESLVFKGLETMGHDQGRAGYSAA